MRQSFNLGESIKLSGIGSIVITSYVTFFSALICLIGSVFESPNFLALAAALLEPGNGMLYISQSLLSEPLRMCVAGFTLGFSGISVYLQVFNEFGNDISRKKYVLGKLFEGIACGTLLWFLSYFNLI